MFHTKYDVFLKFAFLFFVEDGSKNAKQFLLVYTYYMTISMCVSRYEFSSKFECFVKTLSKLNSFYFSIANLFSPHPKIILSKQELRGWHFNVRISHDMVPSKNLQFSVQSFENDLFHSLKHDFLVSEKKDRQFYSCWQLNFSAVK